MPVQIVGLRDLRAQLKAAADASPREVTAALKVGAKEVTDKTKSYIHSRSGDLAADAKPYSTARSAGVRFTLPYAGVQEFATTWLRKSRGSGGGPATRGQKKAHFAGGLAVGGTHEVHYTTPTPRFAFKAVEELAPVLMEATFERLVGVLKAHGWFDG